MMADSWCECMWSMCYLTLSSWLVLGILKAVDFVCMEEGIVCMEEGIALRKEWDFYIIIRYTANMYDTSKYCC